MYYWRSDRLVERENVERIRHYSENNVNKSYDEIVVPSRLAWAYCKFGWQRSRQKIAEERDRQVKGQKAFSDFNNDWFRKRTDKIYQERLRRKKRFGYSWELTKAQWLCIRRLEHPGRGMGLIAFLFVLFCIIAIVAVLAARVVRYPTTVDGYENGSALSGAATQVGRNTLPLFCEESYYVLSSDVEEKDGRVLWSDVSKVYRDGEEEGKNHSEAVRDSVEVDDDGYAGIYLVQADASDDSVYRFYVSCEQGEAPLGFLRDIVGRISPNPLGYGFAALALLCALLTVVFAIWWAILGGRRYRYKRIEQFFQTARTIITRMQNDDPGLIPRAVRMKRYMRAMISDGVNRSNLGQLVEDDPYAW